MLGYILYIGPTFFWTEKSIDYANYTYKALGYSIL